MSQLVALMILAFTLFSVESTYGSPASRLSAAPAGRLLSKVRWCPRRSRAEVVSYVRREAGNGDAEVSEPKEGRWTMRVRENGASSRCSVLSVVCNTDRSTDQGNLATTEAARQVQAVWWRADGRSHAIVSHVLVQARLGEPLRHLSSCPSAGAAFLGTGWVLFLYRRTADRGPERLSRSPDSAFAWRTRPAQQCALGHNSDEQDQERSYSRRVCHPLPFGGREVRS